tara:strand:+ start:152 stop:532 length:381 start_codon:yes stop_codon:yes gene_type:complete
MTLLLVLVMAAFIGMSAMMLFSSVNLEMMIAGNKRRTNQAKLAAISGINHFAALELNYAQLKELSGHQDSFTIIPRTSLGQKTHYEVEIKFLSAVDETYIVKSLGTYQKGDKIISSYPIRAAFTAK